MPDQLVLQNGNATLTTQEGQEYKLSEEKLVEMIRQDVQPPIDGVALPDGVKFFKWQRPFLCVVHQLPAHVRQLRWIAADSPVPYGPGTKYEARRLSLPYAITFATFCQAGNSLSLMGYDELYFRNEPLKSKYDLVGFPALLNVSRIDIPGRSRAWICTQYLRHQVEGRKQWDAQLAALIEHTWNGAFNLSSEHHEGRSWYGESKKVHPELHPVEKWEKASAKNDAFALSVPWKPLPMNVDQLMSAMLDEAASGTGRRSLRRGRNNKKSISLVSRFLTFAQQERSAAKK